MYPIRQIRKNLNLSAAQLGGVIGCSERSMVAKETGERSLKTVELIKIAKHFSQISGKQYKLEDLVGDYSCIVNYIFTQEVKSMISNTKSEWHGAVNILDKIRKEVRASQPDKQRVVIGKKELDFNRRLRKALKK